MTAVTSAPAQTGGRSPVEDWRSEAACVGADLDLFFPLGDQAQHHRQSAEAKQVCARCPVLEDCRRWALKVGPEFGIFGGLTAHERRLVREGRWKGDRRAQHHGFPAS